MGMPVKTMASLALGAAWDRTRRLYLMAARCRAPHLTALATVAVMPLTHAPCADDTIFNISMPALSDSIYSPQGQSAVTLTFDDLSDQQTVSPYTYAPANRPNRVVLPCDATTSTSPYAGSCVALRLERTGYSHAVPTMPSAPNVLRTSGGCFAVPDSFVAWQTYYLHDGSQQITASFYDTMDCTGPALGKQAPAACCCLLLLLLCSICAVYSTALSLAMACIEHLHSVHPHPANPRSPC